MVRHARAGSRKGWERPDVERPLSNKGRHQAEGLVDMVTRFPITRILSSPYVRCMQTVEPVAEKLKLRVEERPELAEGAPVDALLELLRRVGGSTVLWCTHGDIIPAVLEAVGEEDGVKLPDDPEYPKGSIWELTQDDEGRVTKATYFAAPEPD